MKEKRQQNAHIDCFNRAFPSLLSSLKLISTLTQKEKTNPLIKQQKQNTHDWSFCNIFVFTQTYVNIDSQRKYDEILYQEKQNNKPHIDCFNRVRRCILSKLTTNFLGVNVLQSQVRLMRNPPLWLMAYLLFFSFLVDSFVVLLFFVGENLLFFFFVGAFCVHSSLTFISGSSTARKTSYSLVISP